MTVPVVELSWGLSRKEGEHESRYFVGRPAARQWLRKNLFPGVCWWIDSTITGKCLAHGVVPL